MARGHVYTNGQRECKGGMLNGLDGLNGCWHGSLVGAWLGGTAASPKNCGGKVGMIWTRIAASPGGGTGSKLAETCPGHTGDARTLQLAPNWHCHATDVTII